MDSRQLRNAFGQFGTGVAVITITLDDGSVRGLTVNSFASVSLDPPLLSWCLDTASDMAPQFQAVAGFCVNVLAADQQDLSNMMAQPGDHIVPAEACTLDAGAAHITGALAHFDCQIEKRIEAGDHTIYLGAIEQVHCNGAGQAPLLYFRGQYANLA